MSGASIIELDDAGKRFDDVWVVRGLQVDVDVGAIVGLIGPSGCGKTTTVRMITGSYRADEGRVTTLGTRADRMNDRERGRIGYLAQQPIIFDSLTIRQNLDFHASLNGLRRRVRRQRVAELLELVELTDDIDKPAGQASGGMQRRMALAAAMAHEPDLIILDEPTAGIDPILRVRFWEYFRELASIGTTLLITTQYVGEAAYCDRVGLLAEGRLLHYADPDTLRRAAYGGELIRIELARPLDDSALALLAASVDQLVSIDQEPPSTLRIVVADAGAEMAKLLGWLADNEVDVVDSEEVPADYDDIFVRLVQGGSALGTSEEVEHAG